MTPEENKPKIIWAPNPNMERGKAGIWRGAGAAAKYLGLSTTTVQRSLYLGREWKRQILGNSKETHERVWSLVVGDVPEEV